MRRHPYRFFPDAVAGALAGATAFFGWIETGIRLADVSPLRALERIRIPIHFFPGSEDRVIPAWATEGLFDASRGPKKIRIEKGASHGGTAAADPFRYRDEVREFFLEALE